MIPTRLVCVSLLATGATLLSAQDHASLEAEKAAIVTTALDYAEGYYGGEPARMTRALSPVLSKRGLAVRPGVAPYLVEMNAEMLIDAANGAKVPAAGRHITTEVLDVHGGVASARVFTVQFNDYLHLVKSNGRWQILSVLWHVPPAAAAGASAADAGAVAQAVRDYATALTTADPKALLAVMHPLARVRALAQPPQNRPRIVRDQNPETVAVGLAAGQITSSGTLAEARITVHGVDADIAAAALVLGRTTTYLHLAWQEDTWRIVNSLAFTDLPPAPTRAR